MKPKQLGIRCTFYASAQIHKEGCIIASRCYPTRKQAEEANLALQQSRCTGHKHLEVVRVEITPV